MGLSDIFSNQGYKRATILAGALTLVYLLINLFVVGGDDFIITLNSAAAIPLAIATTLFAFSLWNLVKTSRVSRLLWGSLLAGWALWTIAETLWTIFGILSQEVPYPSLADFFWLVGYIPMGFGLYSRLREMPVKPNPTQRIILWVTSLGIVFITVIFVLWPIIQTSEASRWLESLISILYPLADLFLLLMALRLLFVYQSGDYGFSWRLLLTGFVLMTIADLVFAYTTSVDLYYPDQKVNLISSFGMDVPYNLAYLLWLLGIYALRLTLSKQQPFEMSTLLNMVSNTHILIHTKSDNSVIGVSSNFGRIFGAVNVNEKSLSGLLHIPEHDAQSIFDKIRSEGKIADRPILVMNRFGVSQEVYVSGMSVINPQGEHSGCNLVLRTLVEGDYTLDEALTMDEKSMVSYLQQICGSNEEAEIRKLLYDYHLAYLMQLYNLVLRTGGAQLSLVFRETLQQTAKDNQWQLQFDPQTLLTNAKYPLSVLREDLPVLLETAKRFASQLTDPKTVDVEMQTISSKFSEAVHRNVAYHSKQDGGRVETRVASNS